MSTIEQNKVSLNYIEIAGESLLELLEGASTHASKDKSLRALNAVQIEGAGGDLIARATDRYRLIEGAVRYSDGGLDASLIALEDIKQELRLENIASLNARYPSDAGLAGEGAPFKAIYRDQATFAQALGALACYEYQACESDSWRDSYAYLLCVAIRKTICGLISEGEWEYERPAGMAQYVSLMDMVKE